jgi:hypothetical protein
LVIWISKSTLNFQGTFGTIQGTLNRRTHAGNIILQFSEHSMKIPWTFGVHSGNIQEPSRNIQGTFKEHSGNIRGTVAPKRRREGNSHWNSPSLAAHLTSGGCKTGSFTQPGRSPPPFIYGWNNLAESRVNLEYSWKIYWLYARIWTIGGLDHPRVRPTRWFYMEDSSELSEDLSSGGLNHNSRWFCN